MKLHEHEIILHNPSEHVRRFEYNGVMADLTDRQLPKLDS